MLWVGLWVMQLESGVVVVVVEIFFILTMACG